MQRPRLGREELGRGIAELRVEQRGVGVAPFPPPNRLGAHHASFEAHRSLPRRRPRGASPRAASPSFIKERRSRPYLFPEFYPSALSYAGYEPGERASRRCPWRATLLVMTKPSKRWTPRRCQMRP